jgi:hypothetical protein
MSRQCFRSHHVSSPSAVYGARPDVVPRRSSVSIALFIARVATPTANRNRAHQRKADSSGH